MEQKSISEAEIDSARQNTTTSGYNIIQFDDVETPYSPRGLITFIRNGSEIPIRTVPYHRRD